MDDVHGHSSFPGKNVDWRPERDIEDTNFEGSM